MQICHQTAWLHVGRKNYTTQMEVISDSAFLHANGLTYASWYLYSLTYMLHWLIKTAANLVSFSGCFIE